MPAAACHGSATGLGVPLLFLTLPHIPHSCLTPTCMATPPATSHLHTHLFTQHTTYTTWDGMGLGHIPSTVQEFGTFFLASHILLTLPLHTTLYHPHTALSPHLLGYAHYRTRLLPDVTATRLPVVRAPHCTGRPPPHSSGTPSSIAYAPACLWRWWVSAFALPSLAARSACHAAVFLDPALFTLLHISGLRVLHAPRGLLPPLYAPHAPHTRQRCAPRMLHHRNATAARFLHLLPAASHHWFLPTHCSVPSGVFGYITLCIPLVYTVVPFIGLC